MTKDEGAAKAPPSEQKLVEMVERLQRDVSESSAKTDWHLVFAEALEREISSLRAELTRITQRGNEEWQSEARSWFEVHAELLATKVEELSTESEARLAGHARRVFEETAELADAATEQARVAAGEGARVASEERLSRAEQQLAKAFDSAKADLARHLSKTLERGLAEIARSTEARAQSAVRDLRKRLGALRKEADARLAAETKQRVTAAEKSLREATERGARKHENRLRRAEGRLEAFEATLSDKIEERLKAAAAKLDQQADKVDKVSSGFEERVAQVEQHLLDRVAEAETQARERLLALAEELTTEIVVADRAQQREREVHREALKIAAGLKQLRSVSRRASRSRDPGAL